METLLAVPMSLGCIKADAMASSAKGQATKLAFNKLASIVTVMNLDVEAQTQSAW